LEQYVLYLVLKDIVNSINDTFKTSFNDMDSNKDNVVGIYIKGSEPSKYRSLADGRYLNIVNRVQFLIQGGLDKNSLMNSLKLASKIRKSLITTCNATIEAPSQIAIRDDEIIVDNDNTESSVEVIITKFDILGDVTSLGKSEQGKPRYSINFRVNYTVRG